MKIDGVEDKHGAKIDAYTDMGLDAFLSETEKMILFKALNRTSGVRKSATEIPGVTFC